MHDKVLIATYKNPDLDGVACAVSYLEYLNKTNGHGVFGLFGKYRAEADFIFKKLHIPQPVPAEEILADFNKIILVDASDLMGLSSLVDPAKVVEVIDHRKHFDQSLFPNAKFHVEFVGAAATLIAEKFYFNKIKPSLNSCVLLYHAIASNTINFKAKVTTERDLKISDWLRHQIGHENLYVQEMFDYKTSKINNDISLAFVENNNLAFFEFTKHRIGIVQIEVTNAEKIIHKNRDLLKTILQEIKNKYHLDLVFITCIDISLGFNLFLSTEAETQDLLTQVLNVHFSNDVAKLEEVMMRKEIVPLINEYYKRDFDR